MGYWIKGGFGCAVGCGAKKKIVASCNKGHHQNRSVVDEPAVGKSGSQSPTLSPFCLETTPIPSIRSRLLGFCFSICFSPMEIHRTKEPTLLFPRRPCQLISHQMQEESWIFCWYVSV
ncbi:hypothetical protein Goklo_017874 [Gossypium klotzschianum]|uniref:Uncharacterized protein n=1 Tax=Gossypium klotzschianum TaxID=34286 RepID=A0A7J8UIZ0_9ROSI|nr:hypothetical protein [Gossypium klotzschianum]